METANLQFFEEIGSSLRGMEATILQFFEGIRTPALTWVFGIFSTLGEGIVVGAIILLLYWLIGGRVGEQLLVTAASSAAFNAMLKEAVHRPRPFVAGVVERLDVDTPLFSTRDLGDYLSFPSGHAQATASGVFAGAMCKRRAWGWLLAILFLALVCVSRLYFGVHYPTDVLTGAVLGLVVALFWHLIYRDLYDYRYYFLGAFALVCLFMLPFAPTSDFVHMTALTAGAAFFLPLTSFLKAPMPKGWRRLLRLPVGLLLVGAMFAATYFLPEGAGYSLLKWFLLVGAGTFLASVLFKALKI